MLQEYGRRRHHHHSLNIAHIAVTRSSSCSRTSEAQLSTRSDPLRLTHSAIIEVQKKQKRKTLKNSKNVNYVRSYNSAFAQRIGISAAWSSCPELRRDRLWGVVKIPTYAIYIRRPSDDNLHLRYLVSHTAVPATDHCFLPE